MKFSGSAMKNWFSHLRYLTAKGSSAPNASRILARTSGGMVSGRLPVGSLGERSTMAKMMKLMTRMVGIAVSRRLTMYFPILPPS